MSDMAAFIDGGSIAVLLKDDDIVVSFGAELLGGGLQVLSAVGDVFLCGEVLKIVDHGGSALSCASKHGGQVARGRRGYAGDGRIERGRMPNERTVLEFFVRVGRLRRGSRREKGEKANGCGKQDCSGKNLESGFHS